MRQYIPLGRSLVATHSTIRQPLGRNFEEPAAIFRPTLQDRTACLVECKVPLEGTDRTIFEGSEHNIGKRPMNVAGSGGASIARPLCMGSLLRHVNRELKGMGRKDLVSHGKQEADKADANHKKIPMADHEYPHPTRRMSHTYHCEFLVIEIVRAALVCMPSRPINASIQSRAR
eukprot:scaffold159484_cov31-Tisochrysis_lutea.AAC.4